MQNPAPHVSTAPADDGNHEPSAVLGQSRKMGFSPPAPYGSTANARNIQIIRHTSGTTRAQLAIDSPRRPRRTVSSAVAETGSEVSRSAPPDLESGRRRTIPGKAVSSQAPLNPGCSSGNTANHSPSSDTVSATNTTDSNMLVTGTQPVMVYRSARPYVISTCAAARTNNPPKYIGPRITPNDSANKNTAARPAIHDQRNGANSL